MLDLESAQLFLRVAECGSLSRAARESYLAKSMVKHRMDELEEFVGAELLARGSHGVALTKAGEVFKHRAREMLALVETTRAECQAAAHSASGRTIRIAYYSDFVFPMVQYVCDYYLSRHPDDKISPVFIKFQDAHKRASLLNSKDGSSIKPAWSDWWPSAAPSRRDRPSPEAIWPRITSSFIPCGAPKKRSEHGSKKASRNLT